MPEPFVTAALWRFPTETVYGLGADACNADAVAGIFAAKRRPSFNPLISHVASIEAAFALGRATPVAKRLAAAFWPGPMTLILERQTDCPIARLTSAGLDKHCASCSGGRYGTEALLEEFRRVLSPHRAPIHRGASARRERNMFLRGSAAGSISFWMAALAKAASSPPLSTAAAVPPRILRPGRRDAGRHRGIFGRNRLPA